MNKLVVAAAAAALVPVFGPFVSGLPSALADPLANGYDVSCVKANATQVTCTTSGCPRVHEDLAGDVIHTKVSGGPQTELSKACGNATTETISTSSSFDYGVQGCRKHTFSGDDCGAWANYHYEAPATPGPVEAPAPAPAPAAPAPAPVPAPAEVPAAPVTDAITATIDAGIGSVAVNVSNSSDLNGKCTYDSTPFGKHQNFNVPAHGSTPFTISGLNTGTNYHVTINCTDASGKQSQPIGHVEQDVRF